MLWRVLTEKFVEPVVAMGHAFHYVHYAHPPGTMPSGKVRLADKVGRGLKQPISQYKQHGEEETPWPL